MNAITWLPLAWQNPDGARPYPFEHWLLWHHATHPEVWT